MLLQAQQLSDKLPALVFLTVTGRFGGADNRDELYELLIWRMYFGSSFAHNTETRAVSKGRGRYDTVIKIVAELGSLLSKTAFSAAILNREVTPASGTFSASNSLEMPEAQPFWRHSP